MSEATGTGEITGPSILSGSGPPEGVVTASMGTLYRNTQGGVATTLYVKETGTGTNTGWKAYDATPSGLLPVGTVLTYAGPNIPTGFLLCYGQAVSRVTYAGLFSAIGGYFGSGDGSTTFNLPDGRGVVLCGVGNMGGTESGLINSYVGSGLGNRGGVQNHVLDGNELTYHQHSTPDHLHSLQNHQHYTYCAIMNYQGTARGGSGTFSIDMGNQWGSGPNVGTTGASDRSLATDFRGGNWAHINVQPTMAMNMIIKT